MSTWRLSPCGPTLPDAVKEARQSYQTHLMGAATAIAAPHPDEAESHLRAAEDAVAIMDHYAKE